MPLQHPFRHNAWYARRASLSISYEFVRQELACTGSTHALLRAIRFVGAAQRGPPRADTGPLLRAGTRERVDRLQHDFALGVPESYREESARGALRHLDYQPIPPLPQLDVEFV